MKYIFEIDAEGQVVFAPQLLAIKEFNDLWKSRKKDKEKAFKEMSLIFFFVDVRSPYIAVDEDEKWANIIPDVFPEDLNWKPDKYILACMEKYKELSRTRSMDSLESAWIAQKKVDDFLKDVDLNERDNNGKLVHNPKQLQMMQKDTPNVIKALQDTQRLVMTEMNEDLELQAGRQKAEFEDEASNL